MYNIYVKQHKLLHAVHRHMFIGEGIHTDMGITQVDFRAVTISRRLLRVPWTARSNHWILKEINPEYSLKDWCWSWSSNTLATWCKHLTHQKRPWCWERLKARGEVSDRGWDGWIASLTEWTRVWANSGRWWRMGKPGVLQTMRLQGVRRDWVTEQGPLVK